LVSDCATNESALRNADVAAALCRGAHRASLPQHSDTAPWPQSDNGPQGRGYRTGSAHAAVAGPLDVGDMARYKFNINPSGAIYCRAMATIQATPYQKKLDIAELFWHTAL
jgi:hypothetical protein